MKRWGWDWYFNDEAIIRRFLGGTAPSESVDANIFRSWHHWDWCKRFDWFDKGRTVSTASVLLASSPQYFHWLSFPLTSSMSLIKAIKSPICFNSRSLESVKKIVHPMVRLRIIIHDNHHPENARATKVLDIDTIWQSACIEIEMLAGIVHSPSSFTRLLRNSCSSTIWYGWYVARKRVEKRQEGRESRQKYSKVWYHQWDITVTSPEKWKHLGWSWRLVSSFHSSANQSFFSWDTHLYMIRRWCTLKPTHGMVVGRSVGWT